LRDPATGEPIDDALILRFDSPASATGENIVEYQCHGGRAVVDALLAALAAQPGMRLALPGEFTRRAFHNGRIDLTEAEGLADLLEAETESQRRAALLVAEGGLRRQVEAWRARAIELSARAEAAIDYVGDEDETATDATALAREAVRLAEELASWLARPRVEALKDGVRVVVAGPPNAGKSSLINALSQSEKAIVTDVEGTTRDVIEVPVSIGGVPFVLVDTAGLRDSAERVEKIGIARAEAELNRADIVLWLGEPASVPDNAVLVHPRSDLPDRRQVPASALPVSAVTGEGLDALVDRVRMLASSLLPAEGMVAINRRQAREIEAAQAVLRAAPPTDLVLTAESLRQARNAFDRIVGTSGVDDMLDALFGRFCLGK
jgi:tRNA modification GTPase